MRKLEAILLSVLLSALLAIPSGRVGFAQEGNLKANLDLPYDAAGEEEEEEEAPETIVFYGQQYEGDFFCFVADASSSMSSNNRWPTLQREVTKTISGFSERVQFAIVFFQDPPIKLYPPSGQPADANPGAKSAAIQMVNSSNPTQGSCYREGLLKGLEFASKSTSKRKVLICLGDGELPACGQTADQALSATKARNVIGARINTIGIGVTSGEAFLKSLAAQNNGTYRRGGN